MFHVISLDTMLPIANDEGPLVFASGRAAAQAAKDLTATTGKKHQPRPLKDDGAWKEREQGRFDAGIYTPVPWSDKWWVNHDLAHFAHVSTKKPGMLAFTETPEKGAADIQTQIKPGTYLARFYPSLSDKTVKRCAEQFAAYYAPTTLHWATTADEIEHVYINGPRSCMSNEASHFNSPFHPCRVYATGGKDGPSDLSVAYLVRAIGDNENITARALVWQAKQRYSSIYGDDTRLEAQLRREGFTHGLLDGARMRRVECNGAFVVPYVDGSCKATDNGKWLIIDSDGEIGCERTDGISEETHPCDHCGDACAEEDLSYVDDVEEQWCQGCINRDTFYCDHTHQTCTGDSVSMSNGEIWSEAAFARYGVTCEATGDCCVLDDTVTLADGTVWSIDRFETHGRQCGKCGECFANGDTCGEDDCTLDLDETEGTIRHQARQGRDEHVDQLAMPLLGLLSVGDLVRDVSGNTGIIEQVDAEDMTCPYRIRWQTGLLAGELYWTASPVTLVRPASAMAA